MLASSRGLSASLSATQIILMISLLAAMSSTDVCGVWTGQISVEGHVYDSVIKIISEHCSHYVDISDIAKGCYDVARRLNAIHAVSAANHAAICVGDYVLRVNH